ncbi:MAG: prolyl oligopeptidase family serine peptidase, partial [Pyrinomonadaceae bacterium]
FLCKFMTVKTTFAFCLFTFAFCLSAFGQNLTVRDIMAEPGLSGMRPESEKLSPDGKLVVYAWNAEGKEPRNLYVVSTNGGTPQMIVDAEKNYETRTAAPEGKLNYGLIVRDDFVKGREKNLGGTDFSPNSKRLLFSQNSDIYVVEIDSSKTPAAVFAPRRITRTQGSESSARWLDDSTILYQSNGNFYALNIEQTALVQLTKEANPAAYIGVSSLVSTDDGKLAAYIVSDSSKQRQLFVPNYLDEFVQTPSVRRGFSEQKVLATTTDGSREKPFEIKLPKAEGASYIRNVKWAADNASLTVDRVDKDTKRRQLFYVYNVGGKDEKVITITEETDEKWIGGLSRIIEPNPKDAGQILFASERDGYNHLYLATLEKTQPQPNPTGEIRTENASDSGFTGTVSLKQLTKGNYEVDWAKWRPNGAQAVFSSTEANTAEREFYIYDLKTNKKSIVPSNEKGMKGSAQISEKGDSDTLFFEYSTWKQPTDFYAQRICPECRGLNYPTRLTDSVPAKFSNMKWNAPQFISFAAKDGKTIPAKIYLPENFDRTKKYPMVFFVHGAGYLQNVINGWNNYYREFMFNQLLTNKGYVVLDIDYRGSAGYGRDFRTDVYDFLGGLDYQDHLDAIDFAVKNYAVNPDKIGVYGGSYGGFMAEMLVFRAPEKIAAAAALRPVADWRNYFASSPIYTVERLGFPDKNPEGYKRSSPISYAENLKKPLLILHGLVDDNVPAQDSVQLVEKLIRLEKTPYFESMFYPAESHGFTRPSSWTDEYTRILTFFEKHLK